MKKFLKVSSIIIIIFIIILGIIGINIKSFGNKSKPHKSDCVIVLGCSVYGKTPSPFLVERVKEGLKLVKEGYADYIIVSGGKGPGEDISEAEAMKRYLLKKGLKENQIIKEDKSLTTMDNLTNSKKVMNEKGFNSTIIVSNKFHLKRASLMAKKVDLDASYSGVYVKEYESHETYGFLREIPAVIKFYILRN
ncbi:YdcF family protein [Clostridium oceanicum]|uniref:YdcF family protein n=1 Tax=Clostridium oceanicum TaxID=1543 RepID=A0ABP3URH9_9CLOT